MQEKGDEATQSKVAYWQDHIQSCERSGLSQKGYCGAKCLALSTFTYWKRRIGKTDGDRPRFFPLAVVPDVPGEIQGSPLRLNLSGKRFQVEINDDFSEHALKRLVLTLEQL